MCPSPIRPIHCTETFPPINDGREQFLVLSCVSYYVSVFAKCDETVVVVGLAV